MPVGFKKLAEEMFVEIVNSWFQSETPAFIRGARLLPRAHPDNDKAPYCIEGTQGTAFHLVQQENNREWVLKKFHDGMEPDRTYLVAIRSLLPKSIGCTAGTKRAVIGSDDLKLGNGLYTEQEFAHWLQDTILMPKVRGVSWKDVTQEVRQGNRAISQGHRLDFAKSLVDTVLLLEENGCAHRDLCQQNLFLDLQEYVVYLVDFDSLFHGSLYFHKNTPVGTEGYIAPWVADKQGKWDVRKSWHRKNDRFATAILIAELLLSDRESPSYYEGALFSQEMFFNAHHAHLLRTVDALHSRSESLGDLFYKTITATTYDDCPAPLKWREALNSVMVSEEAEGEGEVIVESGYQQQETAKTEVVAIKPITNGDSKVHAWLLLLLLLLPIIFGALYYVRHIRPKSNSMFASTPVTKPTNQSKPAPTTQPATQPSTSGKDIPVVTIQTSQNTGKPVETTRYTITVKYTDNDLLMVIENQRILLNKDNTVMVSMEPGAHKVTLTFTGTVFLPDGMIQRTQPVTQTKEIQFDKQQKITIQINRKEPTWYVLTGN